MNMICFSAWKKGRFQKSKRTIEYQDPLFASIAYFPTAASKLAWNEVTGNVAGPTPVNTQTLFIHPFKNQS